MYSYDIMVWMYTCIMYLWWKYGTMPNKTDSLIDWLIDRLTDRLIDCWLIDGRSACVYASGPLTENVGWG